MIDQPYRFFIFSSFIFLITMTVAGFKVAFPVSIILSLFVIIYNSKRVGFIYSLVLAILYSMIFDNDAFIFTTLNLRVWYFYLILLYFATFINWALEHHRFKLTLSGILVGGSVTLLAGYSFAYALVEGIDAKLSIAKYWIFSVGTIAVLYYWIRRSPRWFFSLIVEFLISIHLFVALWGIFQLAMNLAGLGSYYMYDFGSIRPSGFFSETTWYAEYAIFGIVLMLMRFRQTRSSKYILMTVPAFVGTLISITRNAFVGFFIAALVWLFLFVFFGLKYDPQILRRTVVFFAIIIALGIGAIVGSGQSTFILYFKSKFSFTDIGITARFEAFVRSFQEIQSSIIIGHGFTWYPNQVTSIGTYLGSKSFNLFFMIAYIFGLVGLIPFVAMIFYFYGRTILAFLNRHDLYSYIGLSMFSIYFAMAMFAPIHQYPFGMYVVAISLSLPQMTWNQNESFVGCAVSFLRRFSGGERPLIVEGSGS